jgi:hypothetical protein
MYVTIEMTVKCHLYRKLQKASCKNSYLDGGGHRSTLTFFIRLRPSTKISRDPVLSATFYKDDIIPFFLKT